MSDDDIAQLRRMRDHGEITDAQYDVLRRHVLWGTPLPEAVESLAADDAPPRPGPAATPRHPGPAAPPAYTGPPSGSFPAYTGPPSGGFPAVPPYTGPPSGSVPHYTGPPSGSFPALGHPTGGQPGIPPQQTGWPSGQVPQIPPASTPGWGSESWWQAEQSQGADRQGAGHHRAAPPARPVPEVPGKAEPRSRWRRGRPAFLLSLVLVVAVIGAGAWWLVLRKPGVAPAEYARAVCTQVQGWHDDVTARSGELQQALNASSDPESTRTSLARFFDQVAARTGQLRSDLDGVGTPAIADGPSYVDGLDKRLDDTATSFRDSAQKSRDLNIADVATFAITVQVLQSQVDQLISGVTESLSSTTTPGELRTAYNNASGCAPFTG